MSLSVAAEIGHSLVRRALWHEKQCNWIGAISPDLRRGPAIEYEALQPDLYAGTAGLAWFLGHLHSVTGDETFKQTALGAIRQSLAAAHNIQRHTRLSFHTGIVGVALTAVVLATLLDDDGIRDEGRRCLRRFLAHQADRSQLDLVAGTAGAIAALPIVSALLNDDSLLQFAVTLAGETIRRAHRDDRGWSWPSERKPKHRNLTGFAHGAAGIGYALLELSAWTGDDRFREAAAHAFDYERSLFDAERRNWPDLRRVPPRSRSLSAVSWQTAWCHGAPGIALSRMRAWHLLGEEKYQREVLAAMETIRSAVDFGLRSELEDFSLCHGLAGNTEILYEHESLSRLVARAAREAGRRGKTSGKESPSLFVGQAGVGYLHLRLHDRAVPSVLILRGEDFITGHSFAARSAPPDA